ncbi:transposase [Elizabethkingia argentiflava]|uniref:Transposase n=1 Tax=Elizabethkingia argenteiflava TaxID=2681556 RepID=A0A845PZV0_9FLAO|nr:transposase [Elizabethkingia argenteiflava]
MQQGRPTHNSLIERFNKTFREGVWDVYFFSNLDEIPEITEKLPKIYKFWDTLLGL